MYVFPILLVFLKAVRTIGAGRRATPFFGLFSCRSPIIAVWDVSHVLTITTKNTPKDDALRGPFAMAPSL